MKKHSKKTRIAVILGVILALIMSSMSISYASSGTKKMTAYTEVIVKGNYAYCAAYNDIYKVNLKTGSKKRLVKFSSDYISPGTMKVYKGYLYYCEWSDGIFDTSLNRIKLNGTNKKRLADDNGGDSFEYAISNGKIYYQYYDLQKDKYVRKVMKLNGKNKKKSSYKVKMNERRSNKAKYRIKDKDTKSGNVLCYLAKPNGESIKLRIYKF